MFKTKSFAEYLMENPKIFNGNLDRRFEEGNLTSNNSLNRTYNFLFSEKFNNVNVNFYEKKDCNLISAFIKNGEENKVIFNLYFYEEPTFNNDIKNSKQVESVIVSKSFEGFGLASFVYLKLIQTGITIISDSGQFNDGVQLWKRLARKSKSNDYKIVVFDDNKNDYIKDNQNNIIEYDSNNIDDCEIWSTDDSKSNTLLALISKK